MKINVIDLFQNNEIIFETKFGKGKGIWNDNNKVEKKEYIIEFDSSIIVKYEDIKISSNRVAKIENTGEKTIITGILEEYEDDGYTVMRLGDDIIPFETEYNSKIKRMKNKYITIIFEKLYIYDTKII